MSPLLRIFAAEKRSQFDVSALLLREYFELFEVCKGCLVFLNRDVDEMGVLFWECSELGFGFFEEFLVLIDDEFECGCGVGSVLVDGAFGREEAVLESDGLDAECHGVYYHWQGEEGFLVCQDTGHDGICLCESSKEVFRKVIFTDRDREDGFLDCVCGPYEGERNDAVDA